MTTDGQFEFDIVPPDYVAEQDGETSTETGTGEPEGDSPPPPDNSPPLVNGTIDDQLTGQIACRGRW